MSISSNDFGEEFLTVAEVARLLKLNQQTVRNWIDQGSLPAVRVGRRVRIRRSELERVIEAGSTRGAGGGVDGAGTNAGAQDAGTDAGAQDAGTDAGAQDAGTDAGSQDAAVQAGPNAADFWGGEPVGLAEP